jgi:glycerophosphoryl diester phosphodiesterase
MEFKIIGHRGVPELKPENTISSFEMAEKCGLFGIELDVQLTKDNKIVVFHDSTLERVLNLSGRINQYTYDQLKDFTVLQSDERIPLLEDVLNLMNETVFFIELKTRDENGDRINEGLEEYLHNFLKTRSLEKIVLISFDVVAVREMKEMNPSYVVGLDIAKETRFIWDSMMKSFVPGFLDYLLPEYCIVKEETKENIQKYRTQIIPWSVNDVDQVVFLIECGIDSFISDKGCQLKRISLK